MIGYLRGTVRFLDSDSLCVDTGGVDTGGVGYLVLVPVGELARAVVGQPIELYVHTHVREDALVLFGFSTRAGLALFQRLLSVQGVGPRTALSLLSGLEPGDLVRSIAEGDEARLTKIPGVGKKTAARIVLELADKLRKEGGLTSIPGVGVVGGSGPLEDLRSALANLGYKAPQIDRAVKHVAPLVDEGTGLSELVREALKHVH